MKTHTFMSMLPSEALLQGNESPTPPPRPRAEVRGDRANRANLASARGKGKGRSQRKGSKTKNYGQNLKAVKEKLLSRGLVGKHFSEAEDKRMLAQAQCYRCKKMGHISRNCPNAPATDSDGAKSTSVGFTQDFFFADVAKDGAGANFMVLEGVLEDEIPTSTGADAVSAPDFTLGDDSGSELEVADATTP